MVARLVEDGSVVREDTLTYAGKTSTYGGGIRLTDPGDYDLEVLAMNAGQANFGMVRRSLSVSPAR